MSCFYPVLIVAIGGCWSLPLPSSLTLVWGLQDRSGFLCLVPGIYNVASTGWVLYGNQSQCGTFYPWRLHAATVRLSSQRQYLLQYGLSRPHLLVPSSPCSPPSSMASPAVIFWPSPPYTLLRSWEFSIPSGVHTALMSSLDGLLGPLDPSPFLDETIGLLLPSLHLQDLGAARSPVISPETLHLAASSSPTDTLADDVTCYVAKIGDEDTLGKQEVLSGETDGPSCNAERLPVERGRHMVQDSLLLLAMKSITFKLIIFDLLMTGAAMLEGFTSY